MAVAQADNRCVGGGGVSPPAAAAAAAPERPSCPDRKAPRDNGGGRPPLSDNNDDDIDDHGIVAEAMGGGGGDDEMVAVKRLKYLKQRVVDLDDLELLDRHLENVAAATDDNDDDCHGMADDCDALAAELRRKNKDLVLAARLGKALLAKNDELSLMNERLAEEYGDKLEVLFVIISLTVVRIQ